MPSRTITISEQAYQRLSRRKVEKESFTEVILREVPPPALEGIVGILTDVQARDMKRAIREARVEDTASGVARVRRMARDDR